MQLDPGYQPHIQITNESRLATSPPMPRSYLTKPPEIMNKTGPGFFNSGSEEFNDILADEDPHSQFIREI